MPSGLVWVRRGPHQTIKTPSDAFPYNAAFFSKHRYTFGRDFSGQLIWRRAYASWLRLQAGLYLRKGQRRRAVVEYMRSISIWPFPDLIGAIRFLRTLVEM